MKTCCIIGGNGFIGSALVRVLNNTERIITVIGRSSEPRRVLPRNVKYLSGDFGDHNFIKSVLEETDELIHLAYTSNPLTSFQNPINDITENLNKSIRLFETVNALKIKKVIFISSGGTVYGRSIYLPINENHPTNPISPYGNTKLAIEKYGMMYYEINQLPLIIIRPSNAYGEEQLPFKGQGFIATAIASILSGKEITIFGDKGSIRDYIHVDDLAEGILAVLENGRIGEIYNIGSGDGMSNLDVINKLKPLALKYNHNIKIEFLPMRSFDVPINILDCSKIKKDAKWTTKIPFLIGLERTWNKFNNVYFNF